MLTIELRVNGALIDVIHVTNISPVLDDVCDYRVSQLNGKTEYVAHDRKEGATALALKALAVIGLKK